MAKFNVSSGRKSLEMRLRKNPLISGATLCGFLVVVLWAIKFAPHMSAQNPATACNNVEVTGGYSYAVSGSVVANNSVVALYSIVGVFTADGKGSVSGTDTISENGQVQNGRTFSGTYSVQPNCLGSLALNYTGLGTGTFAFVVSASGDLVDFMQTNNGTVGLGTATRQFGPAGFPIRRY